MKAFREDGPAEVAAAHERVELGVIPVQQVTHGERQLVAPVDAPASSRVQGRIAAHRVDLHPADAPQ